MKTVRLPIYDENGMELREYLEVDLNFFLRPSSRGFASNLARIVEPSYERGDLRQCRGCLNRIVYYGANDGGWVHFETSGPYRPHVAVPKEV